jgi:cation:H+ antiporter
MGALLAEAGLLGWFALFAVAAVFIVIAGTALAKAGDGIAEATGLGGLFIGMLLMAVATSLPEVITSIASAAADSPDLAVGNLFGANMANMATLAVVDLLHRGRVWPSVRLGQSLVASIAIMLTSLAVLAILVPSGLALGWVGLDTIAIAAGYVAAAAWIRRSGRRSDRRAAWTGEFIAPTGWADSGELARDANAIRRLAVRFSVAALVILLAAPVLAISGQGIAAEAGIGETFVGSAMLAVATSLPEFVAAVVAVRIGAHDLAVGNLFGSAAFNMAILLFADLAFTSGPILGAVDPSTVVAGVAAIFLLSIALAAIVHGERTKANRLEPDAMVLLAAYLLMLGAIWVAAG